MDQVVFCTFTRGYGRNPGLIKHGFIELSYFSLITEIPDCAVYVDIYQRDIRIYYNDQTTEERTLDYWGFSRQLFRVCKPMTEIQFPFECHCVVNSVLGEYE